MKSRIFTVEELIGEGVLAPPMDGNHGGIHPKSSDYVDTGIPFIMASDLKDGRVNTKNCAHISEIQAKSLRKGFAKAGDVLLSHKATIGRSALLGNIDTPFVMLTPQITYYRVANEEVLDRKYLYYYFNSSGFLSLFEQWAGAGSTRAYLGITAQKKLPIVVPDIEHQRFIADLLGSLDDKIELNRRMNETMEAMVQAIFRNWFVDFGPTRRKMAGKTDPVEIMGGLVPDPERAAELAGLFPEGFGDNGLPDGWEAKGLDRVATFLNGLALQKYPAIAGEPDLPVIKIAELRSGITANSSRASMNVPDKYVISDGDFLFSWSGSLLAKFWTYGDGALNQHLFKVSSENYPTWFYTQWVHHHMDEFQKIAASKATTMGHIQRDHIKAAMTVCPPGEAIQVMSTVMAPIIEKALINDLEKRTLAATRDLLLPRLMSGEICVGEAEAIVGGAA